MITEMELLRRINEALTAHMTHSRRVDTLADIAEDYAEDYATERLRAYQALHYQDTA